MKKLIAFLILLTLSFTHSVFAWENQIMFYDLPKSMDRSNQAFHPCTYERTTFTYLCDFANRTNGRGWKETVKFIQNGEVWAETFEPAVVSTCSDGICHFEDGTISGYYPTSVRDTPFLVVHLLGHYVHVSAPGTHILSFKYGTGPYADEFPPFISYNELQYAGTEFTVPEDGTLSVECGFPIADITVVDICLSYETKQWFARKELPYLFPWANVAEMDKTNRKYSCDGPFCYSETGDNFGLNPYYEGFD